LHKSALVSCALALALTSLSLNGRRPGSGLAVSADRAEYLRHQLVRLEVRPDSALFMDSSKTPAVARFYHADTLVAGVGRMDSVALKWDPAERAWRGTWAPPWNPPLGPYKAMVTVPLSDTLVLRDSASFAVTARAPKKIPDGFCVMTIESSVNLLNVRLGSPYGTPRAWDNFADWARFLGADAVWYSVGWTIEGRRGTTDREPWIRDNFRVFPKYAEECRKRGLAFGGYVGSYLLWGPHLRKLKYDYSWEYSKGRLYRNHHVDLDDAKRRADIVSVVKQLEADPNVDYIGLDYIRPGAGGFESVDSFMANMNIEAPAGWEKYDRRRRMLWVAERVRPLSYTPVHLRWQWWQARRSAVAVERILAESGVTKPVWGFTLGWDKGHEHGQDPPMMNDAGLDLDAMMIYESNAQQCFEMTNVWSKYLKGDEVQMMAGQQIDWVLLQKSVVPRAPEEFYWRLTDAIKGTTDGGRLKRLFWHDMFRGIRGRKGPHTSQEWLIVGAAAFSKLRQELGTLPLEARMISEAGKTGLYIQLHRPLEKIIIEPLTNASPGKIRIVELAVSTTDTAIILGRSPANGLAAYRLTWGSDDHRDQVVVFSYYPRPYAENPFRPLQSFRAGGDLLIAVQPGRNNSARSISAGKVARDNGLVVNKTALDSLSPSLGYKYSKLLIILGDSLSASEITAVNNFTSALPDFPIALLTNKDSMPGLPDVKMIRLKSDISSDPEYLRFVKSFSTTTKRNYSSGLKLSLYLDK